MYKHKDDGKYLNFDSVADVSVNATINITQRSQYQMKPLSFFIPNYLSQHFLINEIEIGKRHQFANGSPIFADIFKMNGHRFVADMIEIGMNVSISITNIGLSKWRFLCSIYGSTCEPKYNRLPNELTENNYDRC